MFDEEAHCCDDFAQVCVCVCGRVREERRGEANGE